MSICNMFRSLDSFPISSRHSYTHSRGFRFQYTGSGRAIDNGRVDIQNKASWVTLRKDCPHPCGPLSMVDACLTGLYYSTKL